MSSIDALLLKPDAPCFALGEPAKAGNLPGIYMLFGADDSLLYVGMSMELGTRLRQHRDAARFRRGMRFSSFSFLPIDRELVNFVEIAHIHALTPPMNRLYAPAPWKLHETAVRRIRELWADCKVTEQASTP